MSVPWYQTTVPALAEVRARLQRIFPEGLTGRERMVSEAAARTVFVAIYGGAVASEGRWLRPATVTLMTSELAQRAPTTPWKERLAWFETVNKRGRRAGPSGTPWYQADSREQVRDEALRTLRDHGAVAERPLPARSPSPRWALHDDFANLFDPNLTGSALDTAVQAWQARHLTPQQLARIRRLQRRPSGGAVQVQVPEGGQWSLVPGPSSELVKAVIEEFAPRFLVQPSVVWIGEGLRAGDFTAMITEAKGLGLDFSGVHQPDVVLFDLAEPSLLVFVEVDVSGGAVTEARKRELLKCAPGFERCAFVTIFEDRSCQQYRKDCGSLAWDTFVWFPTEPDQIVHLLDGSSDQTIPKGIHLGALTSIGRPKT